MFKRIMLTLTFIAAFSTVGIGISNQAQAWRGGYYGGGYGGYYAPRVAYYRQPVVPFRTYYGPRIVRPFYPAYYSAPAYPAYYAPPVYPAYYGGYGGYGAQDGVVISVGL